VKAIVYICHGSRLKSAQEEAIAFIQDCMKDNECVIQEYAFLEYASPTVEQSFRSCINQGATQIVAIPVLLLTAAHAKDDIPKELTRLNLLYPEVDVHFTDPIGVHPHMIELVVKRLSEAKFPVTDQSVVLLVGRGSSDPDVERDFRIIAEMVKKKLGVPRVEVCFLAGASPSLEDALREVKTPPYDSLYVMPYLLFTGVLMQKIKRLIMQEADITEGNVVVCDYLGYDVLVSKVLQERAKEPRPIAKLL
jgi:sirohydrochlorin ferrochelatase